LAAALAEFSDVSPGRLYVSTDSGIHWAPTSAPTNRWFTVASSADGTRLVAAATTGQIYTSSDSGLNWIPSSAPSEAWFAITSSADGRKLAAGAGGESPGPIYTSSDYGKTWQPHAELEGFWTWIASSNDGDKLVAVEGGYRPGLVYTFQSLSLAGPMLTMQPAGASVLISWPLSAADFILQECSDLAAADWTDVAIPASVVKEEYQLILSTSPGKKFYRLRLP
jgi:hypothetical protein